MFIQIMFEPFTRIILSKMSYRITIPAHILPF